MPWGGVWGLFWFDDPHFDSGFHEACGIFSAQFFQEVAAVRVYGADADIELVGDLSIGVFL